MRGDKRERILRVMLNSKKILSKNELSKQAECSRQWVILFLKGLEKSKLTKDTNPIDKRLLLEYWVNITRNHKKFRSYMIKEPLELLKKSSLEYALTTYQAENLIQHFLFPTRIDLYVKEEDLDKWHAIMTKNGLYGKGNIKVIVADRHTLFDKKKINGLFVVSIPQLIIDLIKEGGPAREAAEMLMKRL